MANPNPTPPEEHQWKEGESGNPNGRPKGSFDRTTIIKRVLEMDLDLLLDEDERPRWLKKQDKRTVYEAMNIRMALSAINGDTKAYNALNRALGDKLDINVGGDLKIALVEFVNGNDTSSDTK